MKRLRVNPLIILPIGVSFYFGFLSRYIMMFSVLFFHEAAHLIAINKRKLEICEIKLEPFGMSIRLKDEDIRNPWDEITVAIAGPLMNLVLSLLIFVLFEGDAAYFLAVGNLSLAAVNLLPAVPLDGGRVLRALLSFFMGHIKSYQLCLRLTKYISFFTAAAGLIVLYKTRCNFSLCLIGCFLFFNLLAENKNSRLYIMREIAGYKEEARDLKSALRVCHLAVSPDYPPLKIIERLTSSRYYIINIIEGKKQIASLTEAQLIDGMIKYGADIRIKELI